MIFAQENAEGHEYEKLARKKNRDSLCTTRLQEGSEYYHVTSIKKANMIPVCTSPAFILEIWKCHHVRQWGNEFHSRYLSSKISSGPSKEKGYKDDLEMAMFLYEGRLSV